MIKKPPQTQWDIFWEPLTTLRRKLGISTKSKKTSAHTRSTKYFFIAAFIAPFIAWGIGVIINPDGWLSDLFLAPLALLMIVWVVTVQFWYVLVAVLIIGLVVLSRRKNNPELTDKIWIIFVFIISLVYSIVVFTFVKDADQSEFA